MPKRPDRRPDGFRRCSANEPMQQTNINTTEYWDALYRREWESGEARSEDYSRNYAPIHAAIIRLIPDGSRVLDIACGPGLLCRKIKERRPNARVLGVDFSEYMIQRNQERDRQLGVDYVCLDIRTALPDLGGTFDAVTMCEILEHLEQPDQVVAAAMDLLKPGGCFILTCPHDDAIPDPEHLRTWGHDDVFHLLAPYSDTVSFTHFPPPWFHPCMMASLEKQTCASEGEERT
jgi:2-polyprenyl-3-methyl-5-hydroxy-6-metoxy-1,4-benzoquinol methylase